MREVYYHFYNYTLNENAKFRFDVEDENTRFYLSSRLEEKEMFNMLFVYFKTWDKSHIIIAYPDSKKRNYLVFQENNVDNVSRKKYNFDRFVKC